MLQESVQFSVIRILVMIVKVYSVAIAMNIS